MPPSGNDSAILLAEYFGEYLSDEKFFNCQEFSNISNNNLLVKIDKSHSYFRNIN